MLEKNCALNFNQYCLSFLSGVDKIWVAYTKDSTFIFENNIIIDIFTQDWYNINFSNCRITTNLISSLEETVLDLEVPYIDLENKNQLKKLKDNDYSFLILTKNGEAFFLNSTKNTQFIQQYTGNGFILKHISNKNKSIYQVSNNYILYIEGKLPIPPSTQPPSENCQDYYEDIALVSLQPNALSINCIVEDYNGWN